MEVTFDLEGMVFIDKGEPACGQRGNGLAHLNTRVLRGRLYLVGRHSFGGCRAPRDQLPLAMDEGATSVLAGSGVGQCPYGVAVGQQIPNLSWRRLSTTLWIVFFLGRERERMRPVEP